MLIGPNLRLLHRCHPIDPEQRRTGTEFARPITVGSNVWFGGGCTVLPGVTIGTTASSAQGSVVTKDIPANCVAAGNPCRVLRPISPSDKLDLSDHN